MGRQGLPAVLWRATRQVSFYDRRFKEHAARPMHRVSLEHLVKFDLMFSDKARMLLQSANFLRTALPVRLARRILDIHSLPYICGINPHIQKIHEIYVDIFNEFVDMPQIRDLDEEKVFVSALRRQLEVSRQILPSLARASNELASHMDHGDLTKFLNTMIERAASKGDNEEDKGVPSINLHIYSSADQTVFCLTDRGGGIPAHVEPHIFDYAFTTIGAQEAPGTADGFGHLLHGTPMAGEGFGLPMARIYARYFGGDLTVQNILNFGVETFLKLKHLDRAAYLKRIEENLDSDSVNRTAPDSNGAHHRHHHHHRRRRSGGEAGKSELHSQQLPSPPVPTDTKSTRAPPPEA
ncbi:hypothetical protein PTSG_11608 [Salpingoeca rosetta]|uniref:Protein-serine/threonine kinase n=1 Tax=Salpingoeca rosetta (strain ATCC 50818 / BSB-021) TaxID=946362 RepID=F2TWS3_SALR5|nr:uncharacterized protein PTSG_11608 [Salpingoeca rosetta]EGD72519.1 hypothetical protein PTSG_11608 [Salpingoeca rosetta]|eukprot:XP_004999088.1 hypothetical protein PTSG_11608 [Salpingoeca rosetta]